MIIKKFICNTKNGCNYMVLKSKNNFSLLRELQKDEEIYYIGEPADFFLRQYHAIKLNDIKIKDVKHAEKIVEKLWGLN